MFIIKSYLYEYINIYKQLYVSPTSFMVNEDKCYSRRCADLQLKNRLITNKVSKKRVIQEFYKTPRRFRILQEKNASRNMKATVSQLV